MVEDGVGEVADVVDAVLVVGRIGEPSSTGGSGLHICVFLIIIIIIIIIVYYYVCVFDLLRRE